MRYDYCYHCMRPLRGGVCRFGCKPPAEQPPNQLPPGTILKGGEYLVGEVLGSGGFGSTYIGCILQLGLRVAIKEYFPSGLCTRDCRMSGRITPLDADNAGLFRDGISRFKREARTLAEFDSEPGIVRVRDVFEENGTAYIVMDYLDGVTLQKYTAANGPIPLDALLPMLRPVMQALQKVHRRGVIHRDISPDNLMLRSDGSLTLLDFGSACIYDKATHFIALKPTYAPLEQHLPDGSQGPWTDVYSLCATIYACITGRKPPDAFSRSAHDTLVPPSRLGIPISHRQEEALMKGLAVHAAARTQSIEELERALCQESEKVRPAERSKWLLPAVFAVAAVLCVCFAAGMIAKQLPAADNGDDVREIVLSFSEGTLELSPGERGSIPLYGLPSDDPSAVQWESSDPAVASVDSNGLVTAKASGSAQITASHGASSAVMTVRVLESGSPEAVPDSDSSAAPEEPEAPRLEKAELYSLDSRTAYGSELYKYDVSGKLTEIQLFDASSTKTGVRTMDSYDADGHPLSAQLYNAEKQRIGSEAYSFDSDGALSRKTRYDKNGSCVSVECYEYRSGQPYLSFSYASSSGEPSGALISCTGYTVGDKAFTARLIYSDGTFASSASSFHCADDKLYLSAVSMELREEETSYLAPVIWPEGLDAAALEWTSSAPGVVRVSSSGQLTALAAGQAVITAAGSGVSAQCVVSVKPAQYVVKAGYSALHLVEGASFQLPVLATKNGRRIEPVTFQSSDSDILSVDSDGTLHAKASLALTTVTVTVSCGGASDQCTVTVYPPHVQKKVLLSYDNANGHYENQYDAFGRLIGQTRSGAEASLLYSETFNPQDDLYAYLRWLLRDSCGDYTEMLSLRSDGTDRLLIDRQSGIYTWEKDIFVRTSQASRDFAPQRGSCTVWDSGRQLYTQINAPIEYTYDAHGRLTVIRLPERGAQVSYVYSYETDDAVLPESITKLNADGKTYSKIDCIYDPASGQLTQIKRWNQYWGIDYTAEYIYDIIGTLTGVRLTQNGTVTEYQFAFNNFSLLSETVSTGGSSETYGCTYGEIWVYQ